MSPFIEKDGTISRPGGQPIVINGTLYRSGQDFGPTNKKLLRAFQVLELNETTCKETEGGAEQGSCRTIGFLICERWRVSKQVIHTCVSP